ncbi:hypothetical protein LP7551_02581 [Roseibium album]|nr:hypothetical protein LP7551_02581 [Roseibium album]
MAVFGESEAEYASQFFQNGRLPVIDLWLERKGFA